ncbi:MAG: hypothetical protein ACLQMF_17680 [Rectinemataceae bacterium]
MGPGLEASPYLWAAPAALGAGLAAGQALAWMLARVRFAASRADAAPPTFARGRLGDLRDRRAGRPARAGAFASLGILAFAGLLVFPPKDYLAAPALCVWALFFGVAGMVAGLRPRAGGTAAAALALAAFGLVRVAVLSWTPFEGNIEIARLFPLETSSPQDGSVYRAELRLAGGGAAASPGLIELPRGQTAIVVESMELRGPLAFLALFPRSPSVVLRLYRVVAIAGGSEPPYFLPRVEGPVDRLVSHFAPLDPTLGFVPGAPGVAREALAGLFVRMRAASAASDVQPLQIVVFSLGDDRIPHAAPSTGGSPGLFFR